MRDVTNNMKLPYLLPDQAQKHVTHNEALQLIDAIAQLVIDSTAATPPAAPAEGQCFIIGAAANGLWTGRAGALALFQDGAWIYIDPCAGWRAWMLSTGSLARFDGVAWVPVTAPADSRFQTLGINASADQTNRLALSSDATLFNNAGNGHQIKINRARDNATGSVLFQTNWSGRAEFGLLGDGNFALKVSPDGGNWTTAISIDGSGVPRFPGKPVCRASLNAAVLSPAAASFTGFQAIPVNQGGFSLGSVVSPGVGSRLVIPATGLYKLTTNCVAFSSTGHTMTLLQNGTVPLSVLRGSAGTINNSLSVTALALLNAGDTLHFQHAGTAQIDFGPGKTELILVMI